MLGFQGGVSIPLVKGGVKAPPAKRQCRAGPKAGARRGFTFRRNKTDVDHTPLPHWAQKSLGEVARLVAADVREEECLSVVNGV